MNFKTRLSAFVLATLLTFNTFASALAAEPASAPMEDMTADTTKNVDATSPAPTTPPADGAGASNPNTALNGDSVTFPDQSPSDLDATMGVMPDASAPHTAFSPKAAQAPMLKVYYKFDGDLINEANPLTVPVTMEEEINLGALLDELSSTEGLPTNGTYQINTVTDQNNNVLYIADLAALDYTLENAVLTIRQENTAITVDCDFYTPDTSVEIIYVDPDGQPLDTQARIITKVIAGLPYNRIATIDRSFFMPLNGFAFGGFNCNVPHSDHDSFKEYLAHTMVQPGKNTLYIPYVPYSTDFAYAYTRYGFIIHITDAHLNLSDAVAFCKNKNKSRPGFAPVEYTAGVELSSQEGHQNIDAIRSLLYCGNPRDGYGFMAQYFMGDLSAYSVTQDVLWYLLGEQTESEMNASLAAWQADAPKSDVFGYAKALLDAAQNRSTPKIGLSLGGAGIQNNKIVFELVNGTYITKTLFAQSYTGKITLTLPQGVTAHTVGADGALSESRTEFSTKESFVLKSATEPTNSLSIAIASSFLYPDKVYYYEALSSSYQNLLSYTQLEESQQITVSTSYTPATTPDIDDPDTDTDPDNGGGGTNTGPETDTDDTIDIPDSDTPLTGVPELPTEEPIVPEEELIEEEILEESVPLTDLPKTGGFSGAGLAALGLTAVSGGIFLMKKKAQE